jgi:hypothetical protein
MSLFSGEKGKNAPPYIPLKISRNLLSLLG